MPDSSYAWAIWSWSRVAPRARIRAARAREFGSSPKTSVALALWTVSGIVAGGEAVEVLSGSEVGRRASSSGANADSDGSAPPSSEPAGSWLAVPPSARPPVPAAVPSPIAAATAEVMTARSVGLAVPPSATWPTSPPTRKSVVVEPVDGLSTSYASPLATRFVTVAPAVVAALRFSASAVVAASP